MISLLLSMLPYLEFNIEPTDELMKLKVREEIYALLNVHPGFYASLFDFTEPWKIDILGFLGWQDRGYHYRRQHDECWGYSWA